MEDEVLVAGRSTRAAVILYVGALSETGHATYDLLRSFTGRRSEGLDRLTLLKIDGKGLVAVLHLLFCMAASEYEYRLGNLWATNEDLPSKGFPHPGKVHAAALCVQCGLLGYKPGRF